MVSDKLIQTIKVLYSCSSCGCIDVPVQVKSRLPEQDISEWMNTVTTTISNARFNRSPHCRVTTLTNIKIPLNKDTDNTYIGEPIRDE